MIIFDGAEDLLLAHSHVVLSLLLGRGEDEGVANSKAGGQHGVHGAERRLRLGGLELAAHVRLEQLRDVGRRGSNIIVIIIVIILIFVVLVLVLFLTILDELRNGDLELLVQRLQQLLVCLGRAKQAFLIEEMMIIMLTIIIIVVRRHDERLVELLAVLQDRVGDLGQVVEEALRQARVAGLRAQAEANQEVVVAVLDHVRAAALEQVLEDRVDDELGAVDDVLAEDLELGGVGWVMIRLLLFL